MTGSRFLGLSGTVTAKITGACPEDCLSRIAAAGIRFRDFQKVDELTVSIKISQRDIPTVRRCAKKTMCSLDLLGISGLVPRLRAMGKRVCYLPVLAALAVLVFWLQGHIWFFSVSGNETIPTERILWVLEENDIRFFTKADSLDMNTVKNQILEDLPELGWITINTEGGYAQVLVRERTEKPAISEDAAPSNVVAKKSGVISQVEVTGGTASVTEGDIVSEGDLLISGISDLDKTMLLTRAQGEVYAHTWTPVSAKMADQVIEKVYTGREETGYQLTWGKKTINFYKTSGISYGDYDKIMESVRAELPGGYELPVTLTKITWREYTPTPVPLEEGQAETVLEESIGRQLRLSLTAGSVVETRLELLQEDGKFLLSGVAECQEEIGTEIKIKD